MENSREWDWIREGEDALSPLLEMVVKNREWNECNKS